MKASHLILILAFAFVSASALSLEEVKSEEEALNWIKEKEESKEAWGKDVVGIVRKKKKNK